MKLEITQVFTFAQSSKIALKAWITLFCNEGLKGKIFNTGCIIYRIIL